MDAENKDRRIANYIRSRLQMVPEEIHLRINVDGHPLPRRNLFQSIEAECQKFLNKPKQVRWLVLTGLRGVGKTVLLSQTFSDLLKKHGGYINLLYLNNDDIVRNLNSSLYEVLNTYQQLLGVTFSGSAKPTIIFVDEIHFDTNWANTVKTFYDRGGSVLFICTGSSSISFQMNADIIGRRAVVQSLYPLSFTEFLNLQSSRKKQPAQINLPTGLKEKLLKATYYSKSALDAYRKLKRLESEVRKCSLQYDNQIINYYLCYGNMPIALSGTQVATQQALRKAITQIVNLDLVNLANFNQSTLGSISELLFILADSGDTVSNNKMAQVLKINEITLKEIYAALVQTGLLIRVPALGNNLSQIKKPARYGFASPALRFACQSLVSDPLIGNKKRGNLLEDLACLHYQREFMDENRGTLYWPYSAQEQADFILDVINHHKLAIEFGLGYKDIKQVRNSLQNHKCQYGLVFSDTPLKVNENANVISIPLDYFYLM